MANFGADTETIASAKNWRLIETGLRRKRAAPWIRRFVLFGPGQPDAKLKAWPRYRLVWNGRLMRSNDRCQLEHYPDALMWAVASIMETKPRLPRLP